MKTYSKSKKLLSIIAAVIAFSTQFVQYYVDTFIFSLIESPGLSSFVALLSKWLLTYGLLLLIGRFYYGRDKRILRFPLAFAFASAVGLAVYKMLEIIFIDFLFNLIYVDSTHIMIASSIASILVGVAVLLGFMKRDSLFFTYSVSGETQESEVVMRNRAVYGKKSGSVIIPLSFGISFLISRFGVIFGYNIVCSLFLDSYPDAERFFPLHALELFICIAVPLVCFLLTRSVSENNMAAFYLVCLFCLTENISSLISEVIRDPIMMLTGDFVSRYYGIFATIVSYIPTFISDILAVVLAVIVVNFMTKTKEVK